MFINIILMAIGFVLLVKGADWLLKGAIGIAKKSHISEILIGIVIVGIGTSLPEIIITIKSAITENTDMILGNAIGSSICNLLLVIGIASVCSPIKIDERLSRIHLPISFVSIWLLAYLCNKGFEIGGLGKWEGVILITFTIVYLLYTIKEAKDENESNQEKIKKEIEADNRNKKTTTIWQIVLYLVLGSVCLNYGADFVVDGAVNIAEFFGVTTVIISMTIVAVGTALPEIVTSILATIKDDNDLAMGNIIGSNIFNLSLLPAIGAIIKPIKFDENLNLSLKSGECLILKGASGCGKSTLLKIFANIIKSYEGNIICGGKNLKNIKENSFWDRILYLSQEPELISGTIKENITMFKDADEMRLNDALGQAGLRDLIAKFEEGVNTHLSMLNLSSGEQQRICLARAFYGDYDVIISDESFSAVDPDAREEIFGKILAQLKEKSQILIMSSHTDFDSHNQGCVKILNM